MKLYLNIAPEKAWKYIAVCLLAGFTNAHAQQANPIYTVYNNETEIKGIQSVTLKDGFHIPAGKTVRIFTGASFKECVPFLSSLSADQNYISTKVFKVPGVLNDTDVSQSGRSTCDVNQTVQYFDGLGRPLQTVTTQGSPTFKDVVQSVAYDAFGREQFKYLPYVATTGSNGAFKTGAVAAQAAFYTSPLAGVTAINGAFSETRFEASPLNRVLEQGAPGTSWQLAANGTGHTQKMEYGSNNNSTAYSSIGFAVRLYNAVLSTTPNEEHKRTLSGTGYYAANELYLTISKDENWVSADGKAGTTEEYKDKEDRVVLKRTFNRKPNNDIETLSTYYVYDDLGNLSFVLPPGSNPDAEIVPSQATRDNYCYQYRHDGRRRLIEKRIPGKGWEEMVYNKLDQLVFSRDAEQTYKGKWLFTKYDALGRVVMTGLYSSTAERLPLQLVVDGQSTLWEGRDNVNNSGTGTGYSNATEPKANIDTYLTINYYDDYNFYGNSNAFDATTVKSSMTKGLATASKVYVLGATDALLTLNYYDDEGRVIETIGKNHLNGMDRVISTWNFAGELTASTRTHTGSASGPTTTIANRYDYDHIGRKLAIMQSINAQPEVVLNKLTYNELGQLLNKDLHSTDNGGNFIQKNAYTYNERGWMSKINDPNNVTANQAFGMELIYANKPDAFNGNVGTINWQTKVPAGQGLSQQLQSFSYNYDKLNRLEKAAYSASGLAEHFNEELTYDVSGNIVSLKRKNAASGFLNNFSYNYINAGTAGNKLWAVTDAGAASQSSNYDYDLNGNQKSDSRKGINIAYNYLNLPQTITKTSTGESINYVFDAAGKKLKKIVGNLTKDYVDGVEYSNGAIEFIETEEGRALPGTNYTYEYMLKDHLGNIRAVVNQNGEITQIQDYYAFGMEMNPGNAFSSSPTNLYKYSGKEKQSELGLDQLDFGARFYDPLIGRWNTIDPLAEKFISLTPYNYTMNNPIVFIDPTGMAAEYNWENGKYYDGGKEVTYNEAMASHGLNADGTKRSSEEPPIDLFGSSANPGSVLHQVPKNWKYTVGDGKFFVFGHANAKGIQYEGEDGKPKLATTAQAVNNLLAQNSPEWKKAMAEGKNITLTIYACNAASNEYYEHNGVLTKVNKTIAQKISEAYPNVTVVAADGLVQYGWDNGEAKIKGVKNHNKNGGFITIRNGEKIAKKQQAYISPGVTKELPKTKIK